jgi:hypothetical protein
MDNLQKTALALVVVIVLVIVLCNLDVLPSNWCPNWLLLNKGDGDDEGFNDAPLYRNGIEDERDDGMEGRVPDQPWSESIIDLGLDAGVVDSHRAFTNDPNRLTTSASNNSVRDYDEDVVPRVGLRLTDYDSVTIGSTSRVVPSEYASQLPRPYSKTSSWRRSLPL